MIALFKQIRFSLDQALSGQDWEKAEGLVARLPWPEREIQRDRLEAARVQGRV